MLLIVRERSWEIGTLKAIGAPNAGIVLGFLTEAVALCAVGALLGTVTRRSPPTSSPRPSTSSAFGLACSPLNQEGSVPVEVELLTAPG